VESELVTSSALSRGKTPLPYLSFQPEVTPWVPGSGLDGWTCIVYVHTSLYLCVVSFPVILQSEYLLGIRSSYFVHVGTGRRVNMLEITHD
jgi:hypothetical protein